MKAQRKSAAHPPNLDDRAVEKWHVAIIEKHDRTMGEYVRIYTLLNFWIVCVLVHDEISISIHSSIDEYIFIKIFQRNWEFDKRKYIKTF